MGGDFSVTYHWVVCFMFWVVGLWVLEDERSARKVEGAKFGITRRHTLCVACMLRWTLLSDCLPLEGPHSLFQKGGREKLGVFCSVDD